MYIQFWCVNYLFHADDAVLFAPSPQAIQMHPKIFDEFAASHKLTYNVQKTFCIWIRPKWLKNISVPRQYLSEKVVSMTTTHKYLVYNAYYKRLYGYQ